MPRPPERPPTPRELQNQINELNTELDNEVAARQAADANLQNQITFLQNNLGLLTEFDGNQGTTIVAVGAGATFLNGVTLQINDQNNRILVIGFVSWFTTDIIGSSADLILNIKRNGVFIRNFHNTATVPFGALFSTCYVFR